jgi:hypothetical protein
MNQGESAGLISVAGTGTGIPTPIITHTRCRRVRVKENNTSAGGPTTDFDQAMPAGASNPIIVLKGTFAIYTAPGPNGAYEPNETIGTLICRDIAGPLSCQQIEDQIV